MRVTNDQTRRDLKLSRQKVHPDGIIAGHDYCVGIASKRNNYEVIAAAHEFCVEFDWQIDI